MDDVTMVKTTDLNALASDLEKLGQLVDGSVPRDLDRMSLDLRTAADCTANMVTMVRSWISGPVQAPQVVQQAAQPALAPQGVQQAAQPAQAPQRVQQAAQPAPARRTVRSRAENTAAIVAMYDGQVLTSSLLKELLGREPYKRYGQVAAMDDATLDALVDDLTYATMGEADFDAATAAVISERGLTTPVLDTVMKDFRDNGHVDGNGAVTPACRGMLMQALRTTPADPPKVRVDAPAPRTDGHTAPTLADIQAKINSLTATGIDDQLINEVIASFGVNGLGALRQEDYGKAMAKFASLELSD